MSQHKPIKMPLWLILFAAAGTFGLTMGTRQNMGLFFSSIKNATGLSFGDVSMAFAIGQLWWGLTQPIAGAMADKVGAGRVLLCGIFMVGLGTFLTPYMHSNLGLILTIGLLAAGGAGVAGPAVLMSTATKMIDPKKRGIATGTINAGGSLGQFLMAPIAGGLMLSLGWDNSMHIVGIIVLLALPAAYVLRGGQETTCPISGEIKKPHTLPTRKAIAMAIRNPSYLMLTAGFFVCGFHIAFLATHLPGVITACGLPPEYAPWSLAILGLFNIVGSLAMGWAVGHWRMKTLLSIVYATRGLAVLIFLLAPKTGAVMLTFAAVMGLTYLATVPPTAGLVEKFFGAGNMATLFGLIFFTHQIGGFLGAYLGGKIFGATGSFNWLWYIDIVLAFGAALIHMPIKEKRICHKHGLGEMLEHTSY